MTYKALLCSSFLLLGASAVLPGCATSSPDNYVEKTTKLACQYLEKCETETYEQGGFDSINDCRDQTLDTPLGNEGTLRDLFVDSCTDFDKSAARTCLRAAKKAKRSCEQNEEPACEEVCGNPDMAMLFKDPTNQELVAQMLEDMEPSE